MRDWGETVRWMAPGALWFAFVLVGLLILVFRHDKPPGPVATRFLPLNTLILPGDLALAGFTGRYVVAPNGVQKGTAMGADDLADRPVPPAAPPVELLLSLPIARAAILGGINADSKVQLCGKAPAAFGTVTVRWVRCDRDEPGASCSALAAVPGAIAADLAAKGLKDETSAGELRLAPNCS